MRTIKFRGKRIDNKEWVYGYLYRLPLPSGEVCMILTQDNIHVDNSLEPKYDLAFTLWVDLFVVDPATVGQLTGFHDRNGKEIYEDDIIDVHIPCNSIGKEEHRIRVVVWNEKCDRFEFQDKRGNCIADSVGAKYNVVYYEVVGNVFDNPDLIEKGGEDESKS